MRLGAITLAITLSVTARPGEAETVKDREGAVRDDRARMEDSSRWIYNDVGRGFAEAMATGRPLLVVLRCVPCLACMGLDSEVLQAGELSPLLDRFVCVRVINANALDLRQFQFDYDLSFSTLFFNSDGTLYARFGSWQHQKDPEEAAVAGYRSTLEEVLAIHAGYPGNQDLLRDKQGQPTPFDSPLAIPSLAGRYGRDLDWDGNVVKSCVHCHQIGDALRASYREAGKRIPPNLIYPMPGGETLGITFRADAVATVAEVRADSAAAHSGILPGDRIATMAGQIIASEADVAWVLHGAPDAGTLAVTATRAGTEHDILLDLPSGWRMKSDISRRVGTWPMRAMAFGGMKLGDLDDAGRARHGIGAGGMALVAEHVGQYGKHAAAKKAGFRKGDILVRVDGWERRLSEGELLGAILERHPKSAGLETAVLRGGERLQLTLPVQ